MAEFEVFPDSELLGSTLLVDGDWGSLTPPHVGSHLPDTPNFTAGVVTIQRVGGAPVERHHIDNPNLQVDVWADTKKHAQDLAARAQFILLSAAEAVYDLPDNTRAVLTAVEPSLGLAWQFDSLNLKPRYTFSVDLTVHA